MCECGVGTGSYANMTLSSCCRYEGTFADDVPHGQGCMVLPTGDKYRGQVQR